jgi:hypothetical protein
MSIKLDTTKLKTKIPGGDLPCRVILTEAERKFINSKGRCLGCGHLKALHNSHCCSFCMVPDCECGLGSD